MRVNCGGVNIHVRAMGKGEPLILIHGLGMSNALWSRQIKDFSNSYQVFALDLRGFGKSDRPKHPNAYDIEVLANDVACVIEHFQIAPCHVLGTSMGGFVAQVLALSFPDLCRSLVLCHTSPRMSIPKDVLEERVAALATMPIGDYAAIVVAQALAQPTSEELKAWVTGMISLNDKEVYAQVLTEGLSNFDVSKQLASINAPTLVITGELDRVIPPEGGREVAKLIPGARHVEVKAVGHLGYAEDPIVFNATVMHFLNNLCQDRRLNKNC